MATPPTDFAGFVKAIEALIETKITNVTTSPSTSGTPRAPAEVSVDALARSITAFTYAPDSNLTFENWYQRYKSTILEDGRNLDDDARVRLLLRRLDNQAYTRYANILRPREPTSLSYNETVERLTKLFGRGESLFSLRRRCLQLVMNESDDWATHGGIVNSICEDFRIAECTPDHFKALIFCTSIQSDKHLFVREQLLAKLETEAPDKINVDYLIDEARRLSNVKKDARLDMAPATVNAVRKSALSGKKDRPARPCYLCGAMHFVRECTYANSKCLECNRVGHKSGYCPPTQKDDKLQESGKKKKFVKKKKKQTAHTNAIFGSQRHSRRYLSPFLNGQRVEFQLDCAADVSVISKSTWERLGQPALEPASLNVKDAQSKPISLLGEFECRESFMGREISLRCLVSASTRDNLFGIDWIEAFGLWDKAPSAYCNLVRKDFDTAAAVKELQTSFPTVFDKKIGICTKAKAIIHLKPESVPIFRPKRPVAFHIVPTIDEELQRLQASGIITPVEYSAWAAPIVVAKKPNGSIRICGDYSTGLNDAVEMNNHPIPDPDSLFTQLANKTVYSHIDLSDAYLQIPCDEASSHLLTINTPRGLFKFNRLPPGIRSAPGIFQEIVERMLQGIPGVVAYFDDICVASADSEEHLATLKLVFKRLEEFNFKVRFEKCKFFAESIKFLGIITDKNGLRPDPDKTEAIRQMPPPQNVQELRSYLGALQFWGKFVPSMSELRAPLDRLLKNGVSWKWSKACQDSFRRFKEILGSELLLTHYDPKMPILIASDASSYAIGCVAYHEYPDGSRKAFYHASRRLTDTESRYSQIEKEALGIVFAVKKFHRFVFGRQFTLLTDHKPLLSIFGSKKGIPVHTANRLQRWALTLLGYNFTIRYISTESFGHADVLSRLISSQQRQTDEVIIAEIQAEEIYDDIVMQEALSVLPVTFNMVKRATKSSPVLQEVIKYIKGGWPNSAKSIKTREVSQLYRIRDALSLIKDVVFYRERLLVPDQFRAKILVQLHQAHPGMARMKALARSYVFWPGIDTDIEHKVRNCVDCATADRTPVKTHLSSWPLSSYPWHRIHMDYAKYKGENFFLVVDSYSKWPEIFKTSSTTTSLTIAKLTEIFARHGIPETLVSDNGTQFTNSEFQKFCEVNGIAHIRTSPYSPASNGQCERLVGTLKHALEKQSSSGSIESSLQRFLATYRVTPNDSAPEGKSPAELMYGRKTRTIFDLLRHRPEEPVRRNEKMEEQYNRRHGTKSRSFVRGEEVYAKKFVQGGKFYWVPGKIIERRGSVSYNVRLSDGGIIRSHTNQLKRRYTEGKPETTSQALPLPLFSSSPQTSLSPSPFWSPPPFLAPTVTSRSSAQPSGTQPSKSTPVSSLNATPVPGGSRTSDSSPDVIEVSDSEPELSDQQDDEDTTLLTTPERPSDPTYIPPRGHPRPEALTPVYRRLRSRVRPARLSNRFPDAGPSPSKRGRC
ncbi:uncharacterized protein K02A2.6-like [Phlebotomus papatasi]|uniref:uncharacterized protein K02A2.6-like n=1 Tax=Phlebotomus papatasi TaxID=29031 RepID=UPI0024836501|nr:uncharacterized protein K02A2.6-like [Phlebotomus papatasi]